MGLLRAAAENPRRRRGPGGLLDCPPLRRSFRLWLPAPVLERLSGVTTGLFLLLPQLEEIALLPAPLVFRRPFTHHALVLPRLDHLTGDLGTEDSVMALAARGPVMVHQFVAAGHAL